MVCKEHDIAGTSPTRQSGLIGFDRAVELALQRVQDARRRDPLVVRRHAGRAQRPAARPTRTGPAAACTSTSGTRVVDASPEALWRVIEGIGGENGWYSWPLGWWARGVLDRLVGGLGLRRGRRDPRRPAVGDALDWWRVEEIEDRPAAAAARRDAAARAWPGWS